MNESSFSPRWNEAYRHRVGWMDASAMTAEAALRDAARGLSNTAAELGELVAIFEAIRDLNTLEPDTPSFDTTQAMIQSLADMGAAKGKFWRLIAEHQSQSIQDPLASASSDLPQEAAADGQKGGE